MSWLIEELDVIDNETEALQQDLKVQLFAVEKMLEPVDVMFLYRVIELTGQIGGMSQRVGRRLRLLLSH